MDLPKGPQQPGALKTCIEVMAALTVGGLTPDMLINCQKSYRYYIEFGTIVSISISALLQGDVRLVQIFGYPCSGEKRVRAAAGRLHGDVD